MRKLSVFGLLLSGVVLSGCSLLPTSVTPSVTQPEAFRTQSTPGSLWKSTDGGQTFEPKITVDEKRKITSADVLALSFLPNDPMHSFPTEAPGLFAGTINDGIFKTTDGGEEWQPIGFPPKKVYSFTADKRDPNRMYATGVVGDRGKIFRTTDGGANWKDVYTEPGSGTVIVSLSEHPVNTNVIFAGTSAGTVVKSTDGGDTWKNVGGQVDGPVTEITFDATKPLATYLLAFNLKTYYSLDGGENWIDWEKWKQEDRQKRSAAAAKNASSNAQADLQKQFQAEDKRRAPQNPISLVASPTLSGTLFVGTNKGLFVSHDSGKFWDEVNIIESAKQFPIRAIALHPKNSDEIAFVSGHAFYKSINNGLTWSVVPLSVDREVSTLVYDPFDPQILYMGLRKY